MCKLIFHNCHIYLQHRNVLNCIVIFPQNRKSRWESVQRKPIKFITCCCNQSKAAMAIMRREGGFLESVAVAFLYSIVLIAKTTYCISFGTQVLVQQCCSVGVVRLISDLHRTTRRMSSKAGPDGGWWFSKSGKPMERKSCQYKLSSTWSRKFCFRFVRRCCQLSEKMSHRLIAS